ncbi:MAG: hypothetical protein MUF69_07480 [Desulfobacterota bacterium]|nr:hypothetical protein [Thermodesulfobacteriota bacterium]
MAGGHKTIQLLAEETAEGPRIRLRGQLGLKGSPEDFPAGRETALLEALNAEMEVDEPDGGISLRLLKTI